MFSIFYHPCPSSKMRGRARFCLLSRNYVEMCSAHHRWSKSLFPRLQNYCKLLFVRFGDCDILYDNCGIFVLFCHIFWPFVAKPVNIVLYPQSAFSMQYTRSGIQNIPFSVKPLRASVLLFAVFAVCALKYNLVTKLILF